MNQYFDKQILFEIFEYFLSWNCNMENQILQSLPQQPLDNLNILSSKNGNESETLKNVNLNSTKAHSEQSTSAHPKTNQIQSSNVNKHGLNNQQILLAGNNNLPASLRQPIKLIITDIIPQVLVSDGHHYVEAVFTTQSIGDLRRSGYLHEISRLRDKIIYVSKWSLQIDYADSQIDFHSFENFKIRIVIEQFQPKINEQVSKSLLFSATSIFRCNEKIQPLMKNFRNWFQQTLIYKSAWSLNDIKVYINEQQQQNGSRKAKKEQPDYYQFCSEIKMPSLKDVIFQQPSINFNKNIKINGIHQQSNQKASEFLGDNQLQMKFINTANHSHNSQNTTQQSLHDHHMNGSNTILNDENLSQENYDSYNKFGGQIQNSQIFRYKQQDFQNESCFKDNDFDFEEFKEQILLKKKLQGKDYLVIDIQRTFLTELGELAYDCKFKSKAIQWQDQAQDEMRREQIKQKIEYFQINSENILDNLQHTVVTKEERELYTQQFRNSRKLIGYKIERHASHIKQKLLSFMNMESKNTYVTIGKKKQITISRPRANSQENIIQFRDETEHGNIMENSNLKTFKREGLSQNVYQKNYDMDNETQSERSDMDSELQGQINLEKQRKTKVSEVEITLRQCQASISIFSNYLDWMEKYKLASLESFEKIMEEQKQGNNGEKIKIVEAKIEKQVVKKRANEHRNSRKQTKYVDDEYDDRLFFRQQLKNDKEEKVENCEDEKMESWSDQKDDQVNQDIDQNNQNLNEKQNQIQENQINEEFLEQNEKTESLDEDMQDLENEQNVLSSSNNQLNLIADTSSSNNQNIIIPEQNLSLTPKITYRSPFIEPPFFNQIKQEFIFTYNVQAPIPSKPMELMNSREKLFYDMEIEEYYNERDIQEKKQKQIFLKQQRELLLLNLQEEEKRNNERNQMAIEDFESRKIMQIIQENILIKIKELENQKLMEKKIEEQKQLNKQNIVNINKTQIQSAQQHHQKDLNESSQQSELSEQNEQQQNINQEQIFIEKNESDNTESEEIEDSDIGSSQKENQQDSLQIRRIYAENMNKKYGRIIDKEIGKCTHKDMQTRDYKSRDNSDRIHDILKVFNDKQQKNKRSQQYKQRLQSGNTAMNDNFDEESLRSPKFQSLEDAEKEMNNKEYLISDEKQFTAQKIQQIQQQNAVADDFPSFQENIEESDSNQIEVQQQQNVGEEKCDENEEQEDEWDEPNGAQNKNEGKNKYDRESEMEDVQNESYGDQKSEEYEDIDQNERVDDPQLYENQEIKQEQDVVEVQSSHSQDQEQSDEEVQELQSQNNYRNNHHFKIPQNNFKNNNITDNNKYDSMQQRQSPQTPPQYSEIQAYGNPQQYSGSQSKNVNQLMVQKNYNQRVPTSNEHKNKPPLISQSPNRGLNMNHQEDEQLQQQQINIYYSQIDQMNLQIHKINQDLLNSNQQTGFILKQQELKILNNISILQQKINSYKNNQKMNDPKIFKGRQNYNQAIDQRIQQSDRKHQFENDAVQKKNMSPSKNTPHFPINSQRPNSQMRPEYYEQQRKINVKNQQLGSIIQNKYSPNSYKVYHQKPNTMQQFKNQKLQKEQIYNQVEDECNPLEDQNGPQDYLQMENENCQDELEEEPEQNQILIEQEEDDYHVPSFGSQVKPNRDDLASEQRNNLNNMSSANKRFLRSKSPENIPNTYRVQPFSVNGEEDEPDQDQQDINFQDHYQRQSSNQQKMNPEHYMNQNVGQKRNFQQYQQNNQQLRNRSRSMSQSRAMDGQSKQNQHFIKQNNDMNNSYYQGQNYNYVRDVQRGQNSNNMNQSQRQLENELKYKNLSEFAASQLIKQHVDNVQQKGMQKDIKQLEKQMSQKQKFLQQLQQRESQLQKVGHHNNHEQMGDYYQQDQDGEIYEQQVIRGDKINKQIPVKNQMQGNIVNQPVQMKRPMQQNQQNMSNKNYNDYQVSEQSKQMQNSQRPRQNIQMTPQQIQALQQQYSQKTQNNFRQNQVNGQNMNQMKPGNFVPQQMRHNDQILQKNLQPLIPGSKRMMNGQINPEQFEEKNQIINQNNLTSAKIHNSSSSKKNNLQIIIDDHPIQGEKIIGIQHHQQKQLQDQQHDSLRKQQNTHQQKLIPPERNQNIGNMTGFGNKRINGQAPINMQYPNESFANQQQYIQKKDMRQDPQKIPQKLLMQNSKMMNAQYQQQNEKQKGGQFNQFENELPIRAKQTINQKYQKNQHSPLNQVDLEDVNYDEQIQQQFPLKRRRIE